LIDRFNLIYFFRNYLPPYNSFYWFAMARARLVWKKSRIQRLCAESFSRCTRDYGCIWPRCQQR